MQNDFLSSLSSRALQDPGAEASVRGLQPRLASRFENLEAPLASATHQGPNPEGFVEVKDEVNTGSSRHTSAQERARMPVAHKDPISKERSGLLTVQEPSFENAGHPLQADRKGTLPAPYGPTLVKDQSDMSPIVPVMVERSAFPRSQRRNQDIQAPASSPLPDGASFRENPDKTSETHSQTARLASTAADLKTTAPPPALPADLPGVRPKVVPERIEVTSLERQIQLPANGSQLVPSMDLPRLKTQSTTPEMQQEPPTIHVTIGRIEVKATPPAGAPKRRASASSTMSLDEYLRRRSGGER